MAAVDHHTRLDPRYDRLLEQVLGIFKPNRDVAIDVAIEAAKALGQTGDPRFEAERGRWLLTDGPDGYASTALEDLDFVVVDVESTGGSPARGDRLTEIAAVRVSGGRIVDSFESLINPQRPIPPTVTRPGEPYP